MDFPKAELVSHHQGRNAFSFLYEKILFLKAKLTSSINANTSPSHRVILDGIVFGNDKNMPRDVKDKFNATGLSHITAVSGSNIVILVSVVMVFLLAIGFWRSQAFYITVAFIWIYIVLIGFPVSSVRAGIMGSVALLAQNLSRQNSSSRIIMLTAAAMLFLNPMLLFYDVSFQLSFLASLGIIYLKPFIDYFMSFPLKKKALDLSKWKLKTLSDIISVTFSAQLFTLPIIAYNFGSISLVAPVTNILVLPLVPLMTMLGFLISLFGIFSSFLAWVFYLPCWLLLTYLLKVMDVFYQPWAVTTMQNISWIWILVYYVILFLLIKFLQKYQKPKFLGY
jgi:competence protein ComEC